MSVNPLPGIVLLEPEFVKEFEDRAGLIIHRKLAKGLQGAPKTGWIRAIGDDVEDLRVGLHVVFNDKDARGFKFEGKSYIPVKAAQVIAIIEDQL